ncbi:MAG TPA: S8 family serine peptidase [Saprospiraceae bacterium]|nr:S8 family serine peptidase [Saprospiraceae bacterium]
MILILLYTSLLSLLHLQPSSEPLGRWLVRMNSTSTECIDQWWQDNGFDQTTYLKKKLPVDTWMVVELPQSAINSLENLPCVNQVMVDQKIQWRNTVPNDPQYISQGDMNLIGMPKAWDITTGGLTPQGDTIVVAVIDDGYDVLHQDLAPNIWLNKGEIPNDGIDNDDNDYIDDYRGLNLISDDDEHLKAEHGTQVAGVIGARGNNNKGVSGENWVVKLMLISGGLLHESTVIEGYEYVLEMRKKYNQTNGAEGAFVVATNLSGGIDYEFAADHPLWCEMYDKLGAEGILNVVAAPNTGANVDVEGDMPTTCNSDFMIGVTNVDLADVIRESAGFGSTSIDLGAPGEGTYTLNLNNTYKNFGGASAATPHVTGTIALLYSLPCAAFLDNLDIDPDGVALKIKDFILENAKNNNSLQDITVTGKRLQVDAALKAALDECNSVVVPLIRVISVAPNPVTRELAKVSILVRGDSTNVFYDLYAANGDLVKSGQVKPEEIEQGFFMLDFKPLAAAVYMLTIRRGKEKDTLKVFVY